MVASIVLRRESDRDAEFLCGLYASTREEEMAPVPWPQEWKRAFLADQFRLQTSHYREHFGAAAFLIIEREGLAIGRLYVDRTDGEIRLLDIALSPECRGRGIGGEIIGDLIREARNTRRIVTIHVEHNNPARRLYERLGFQPVEDRGVYQYMEWRG